MDEAQRGLDAHCEFIKVARAGDDALVMRCEIRLAQDQLFDLRREDVDAADDHHVVAAAGNLGHAAHAA